tara:strand:+ start:138 stop:383 length:246 start_codon:yes stop_codon:yes gene_type:complete
LFAIHSIYDIKEGQLMHVLIKKEVFMDNSNQAIESFNQPAKAKASSKKRKWREIEELMDKFQLEKELKVYDDSLEHLLEEF